MSLVTNGGSTIYANTFDYHPSGSPLSFKPGGAGNSNPAQAFTYDNRYRLWTQNTGQRSFTYGYDKVGNTTSITEGTRAGLTTRSPIGYDALDRLTSITGFTPGAYSYDDVGNRQTSTVAQTPASYSYSSSTSRLTSFTGSGTLTYDNNGNLTNDGRTYSYTPDNLLEVVQPSAPVATYRYDGDNLRTMKIDGVLGSTRYFIHGPGGQILSEFEEACAGNRTLVRDYVYAGSRLLADVKPSTPPVQVAFVQASSTPSETAGTHSVGVRITTAGGGATTCPVTVQFATLDGTAIAGTNYAGQSGALSFPASSPNGTVKNIGIPILNNNLCQGNLGFAVRLSGVGGATLVDGDHAVTIVDDDLVCLSGTKSVTGGGDPGAAVTYSIVLANSGSVTQPNNAGNEFTDTLSTLLTLDSVSSTSGTATMSGNTASWNGTVPPGSQVTITLNSHANPGTVTAFQLVTNTGTINYDLHNTGSNTQTASTNTVAFVVGSGATSFFTVTPCRIVDTRNPVGPLGGPALVAGAARVFPLAPQCSIPFNAAVALNVTVIGPTAPGYITVYPPGSTRPITTTLNYSSGATRSNNVIALAPGGQVEVYCNQAAGTADLVIDVTGYFQINYLERGGR